MNRHEPHTLGTGCFDEPFLGNHIGVVAKAKIGIDHGGRFRGFDDFRCRGGVYFAAAKMLEIQMQVAESYIADALGLGVHDLLGDDRRLFVAGAGAFQRISAKGFDLVEGEYRHGGLLASALIVSKTGTTHDGFFRFKRITSALEPR